MREAVDSICQPLIGLTVPCSTTVDSQIAHKIPDLQYLVNVSQRTQQLIHHQIFEYFPSLNHVTILTYYINALWHLSHLCLGKITFNNNGGYTPMHKEQMQLIQS